MDCITIGNNFTHHTIKSKLYKYGKEISTWHCINVSYISQIIAGCLWMVGWVVSKIG